MLRNASFLPSCILAGVGLMFLVLAFTLPPLQVFGVIFGSAVAVGLILARLRRDASETGSVGRIAAKG